MGSLFIAGTDTDVGKTYVTAGLAATLRKMSINVGVMKPFAAGIQQKRGLKSTDAEIISQAAQTSDPEHLINPQFFPIPASPYTAHRTLGIRPKIRTVLSSFKRLSAIHDTVLVEGMGGVMTPITKSYHVVNLIKDMGIPAVIIARNRIGTINHTIMTVRICKEYKIPVRGIIISNFETDGYKIKELIRDLTGLLNVPVLGTVPFINNPRDPLLYKTFERSIDFKRLLK